MRLQGCHKDADGLGSDAMKRCKLFFAHTGDIFKTPDSC
jgi:hypothetical protein